MVVRPVWRQLPVLGLVLYPFYVWWAVNQWHPALVVLPVVLLMLLRVGQGPSSKGQKVFLLLSGVVMLAALSLGEAETALRYYPVWMNAGMLLLFVWSLLFPPTVIEQIATLMEGPLDPKGQHYTKRVTQVWCVFFLCNGSLAGWTAWYGDWQLWVLYNGGIAYLLMGGLMGGEWLVRRRVRAA